MPRYELLFKVYPEGAFGLPEEGRSVHPVGTGITSDIFNPVLNVIVGYGTLSKYRDSPLVSEGRVSDSDIALRVHDNILAVQMDATDDRAVIDRGIGFAIRFCTLLSCYGSTYFHAELIGAGQVDEAQPRRIPRPRTLKVMSVRTYDLAGLSSQVSDAVSASAFDDPTLEKAAAYFYHAIFERDQRNDNVDFRTIHFKFITAELCLNCYKAVSTILGEAGVDKDYQSRYRSFGIPEELWKDSEKLRELRNAFDVAHYKLDWGSLEAVQAQEGFAISTTQRVIAAYASWLIRSRSTDSGETKE